MTIDTAAERSPEEEASNNSELKRILEERIPPGDLMHEVLITDDEGRNYVARRGESPGDELQVVKLHADQIPGRVTRVVAEEGYIFNEAGQLVSDASWGEEATAPDTAEHLLEAIKKNDGVLETGPRGEYYGTGQAPEVQRRRSFDR